MEEKAQKLCFEARELLNSAAKEKQNSQLVTKAGQLYLEASQLAPKASEPYMGLAVILYSSGKYEKAMGLLEQATELDPVNRRIAQLKKRCLKALEKGIPKPTSTSTVNKVKFSAPVSPLKLLRTLSRDVPSPRVLFKLVEQVYGKKLSKTQATVVFHLISTGTTDGETEATTKDEAKLGNLLKSLNEDFVSQPQIFAQDLKNRLKSFHRFRFLNQVKSHIEQPKDLFIALKTCYSIELSKAEATVLYNLIKTQTIDGKKRPTTLDKLNAADLIGKILQNQQPFGEQMQNFVITLDKYFKEKA